MPHAKTRRVFSAIQPSGDLHIGNYLGALRQWVALQDTGNTCTFSIVDFHAITVPYDPKRLPETSLKTAALLLAVGIDPKKSVVFFQSHVPAHTEAAWLLTTITPVGALERMTQYKEKTARQKSIGAGLLNYPILMAADILLYETDLVPVGEDQKQHLEFARALARTFNRRFGETLKEPRAFVIHETARIMSLQDPARKMSKSDPLTSVLALWDSPETIQRKLRSAVTDSGTAINPKKLGPALINLLGIYAAFAERTVAAVADDFAGRGYAVFKQALADLLVDRLTPLRMRALALLEDRARLQVTLTDGATRAATTANTTLARMKDRMGLLV